MKSSLVIVGAAIVSLHVAGMALFSAANEPKPLSDARQLIVVQTPDWNTVDGRLRRFERANPGEAWRPVGAPVPIVVGKTGLAWGIGVVAPEKMEIKNSGDPVKQEGDGKSPAGVFSLGTAFGAAEEPPAGARLPYLKLTPSIECVDDAGSAHYNRVVDRATVAPDWKSSEHMLDVGTPYRWGVVVEHNNAAEAGKGSCIFLHIWSGPGHGTVGCTAMPQADVEQLIVWLDPTRKPLLVQVPAAEYKRLKDGWKLPEF